MTEHTIVKTLENLLNQGDSPIGKEFAVIIDKHTIKHCLKLIEHKNQMIKSLETENKQIKSDIKLIANDYACVKDELESTRAKATEIINKYIDKYKELCKERKKMKDNRKEVKEQSDFCKELMNRLADSVDKNIEENFYYGIHNHSQIMNDIIRLRRELSELSKLLKPEW